MPVSAQENEGSGALTKVSRAVEGKFGGDKAREYLPLEEEEPHGVGRVKTG